VRGGASVDEDGPLSALRAFGATPEQIEEARQSLRERGDDACLVLPPNWPALMVFLALDTQWRRSQQGRRLGIDYTAIEPVLRLKGVPRKKWQDVFWRLQVMELAAVEALSV
jgi:hypothetical protein